MHSYQLKRSKRRTLSMEITKDLHVLVRAPLTFPKDRIDHFVAAHTGWIEKHISKMAMRIESEAEGILTEQEQNHLKQLAKEVLPQRTEYYGNLMGLKPTAIKITSAKKRFGSCNGKNSICYSYHLMRYPKKAVDYVVVHELAHIKHKNHGKKFYELIEKYLPDYKERRALLGMLPCNESAETTLF